MFIYLATPYSNTPEKNFQLAEAFTASQLQKGMTIFSPIVHCHEIAKNYNLPKDFKFWKSYNLNMLKQAEALWVLKLPGWNTSKGVHGEIEFAEKNKIPIRYLESVPVSLIIKPNLFTELFRSCKQPGLVKSRLGYSFQVNSRQAINFRKIMDDLSYSDPLRLVKVEDKLYAVVHHSVQEKFDKCVLQSKSFDQLTRDFLTEWREDGYITITHGQIKYIVKLIRDIKKAMWKLKYAPDSPKPIQVEVIKVKV